MNKSIILGILLLCVRYSDAAAACDATWKTANAGHCCAADTTKANNLLGANVNECDTTGTANALTTATKCNAGYLLKSFTSVLASEIAAAAAIGCEACPAGTYTTAGNKETACFNCPDNVATCTATCTLTAAFICPTEKVFTAVTCQNGFVLKASTPATCVAATVAGCIGGTANDAGVQTCLKCGASGYRTADAVTGACTTCTTAGCGVCTAVGAVETCTGCKDGFFDSKVAPSTTPVCTACAAGCATCPDATKCTTVQVGWKLSAAAPATPTACGGDSKTSAGGATLTCDVACKDTNCSTCNADSTKCEVCKDNFEVQADFSCKAVDAAKIHPTCKTVNKPDSADNCTSCDSANNRQMEMDTVAIPNVAKKVGKCVCKAGFGDASTSSVAAAACVACGTGVKTCNIATKMALTCTDAAQVVAGANCFAKAASTADGFFYDTASSTFKICNVGCATCTGAAANQCAKCPEAPVNWVEPTSLASNFAAYIKGPRALINGTCYGDCPTGFIANTARSNCVAGAAAGTSGSGILAVLSLVASIFLIF